MDIDMGCMGIDVMTGLVRPAEEEAISLGWEGVGAAGVENMKSSTCGGLCLCASLEG